PGDWLAAKQLFSMLIFKTAINKVKQKTPIKNGAENSAPSRVTSPEVISLFSGDHSRRGFHGVRAPCNTTGRSGRCCIRNRATPLFNRHSVSR
ncbi:TPA: hypothetical protein ACM7BV_005159, partial [Escherichia coli]